MCREEHLCFWRGWLIQYFEYFLPRVLSDGTAWKSPEHFLDECEKKWKQCSVPPAATEQQGDMTLSSRPFILPLVHKMLKLSAERAVAAAGLE